MAEKLTPEQLEILKSESEFQSEKLIPTHKMLAAGITTEKLKTHYARKRKISASNDLEQLFGQDSIDSQDSELDEFQILKKKSKLTKTEKSGVKNLSLKPVLIDSNLQASAENVSAAEKIESQRKNVHKISENLEHAKLAKLFPNMTEIQQDQYEVFRRSHLNRANVRKTMQACLQKSGKTSVSLNSLNANVLIAVSGISKIFLCQVVEKACEIRNKREDSVLNVSPKSKKSLNPENPSGIEPSDIREAFRLLTQKSDFYGGKKPQRDRPLSKLLL